MNELVVDREIYIDVIETSLPLIIEKIKWRIADNFKTITPRSLNLDSLRSLYIEIVSIFKVNNILSNITIKEFMNPTHVLDLIKKYMQQRWVDLPVKQWGYIKWRDFLVPSRDFNNHFNVNYMWIYDALVRSFAFDLRILNEIPIIQIVNAIVDAHKVEKENERYEYFLSLLNMLISKYDHKIFPWNPKYFPHRIVPKWWFNILYFVVQNNSTWKLIWVIIDANVWRHRYLDDKSKLKAMINTFEIPQNSWNK